jgi:hypothetical protein
MGSPVSEEILGSTFSSNVSGIQPKTSSLVLTSIQWDMGPTASGVIQWDAGPMASGDIIAGIQWDTGPMASGEILAGIQWDTGPTASGVILFGIQWDTGSSQKREWTSPARARVKPRGRRPSEELVDKVSSGDT